MNWLIDELIYWWNDELIYWWIDEMINWWIDELMNWWIDELINWWIDILMNWFIDELMNWWIEELRLKIFVNDSVVEIMYACTLGYLSYGMGGVVVCPRGRGMGVRRRGGDCKKSINTALKLFTIK